MGVKIGKISTIRSLKNKLEISFLNRGWWANKWNFQNNIKVNIMIIKWFGYGWLVTCRNIEFVFHINCEWANLQRALLMWFQYQLLSSAHVILWDGMCAQLHNWYIVSITLRLLTQNSELSEPKMGLASCLDRKTEYWEI